MLLNNNFYFKSNRIYFGLFSKIFFECRSNKFCYKCIGFWCKYKWKNIKYKGNYTFFASTNDGSKLLIDHKEIINNDGAHASVEKSGKVYLEKGNHLIELRYFQAGGGKEIKISWKGPGFKKREMTKEDLSID